MTEVAPGPLAGLRVLDLSWEIAGPYCTKLLAGYGAEVIKVERPGGDPARLRRPFYKDVPDPEGSLLFLYLNTDKRSVCLNLRDERGRDLALQLVEWADVVVENFRPGVLQRLGLDFETLHARNPRLILTSISNFGQTGPYRDLPASELVEYAMSGLMAISGSSEREPLKHGLSQGQYAAGVTAAYITAALTYSQALGAFGQWIDVSILECLASELVMNEPYYAWMGGIQGRRPVSGDGLNNIMPCRDGYVVLQAGATRPWPDLVEFLGAPELGDERYATPDARLLHSDEIDRIVAQRLLQRDKRDLFHDASRRRLLAGMVQDPEDLLACPQLAARGFFTPVNHPTTGPLPYPGEPVKMSATPWTSCRPAPLLGQDTDCVLAELLGLQPHARAALRAEGVTACR